MILNVTKGSVKPERIYENAKDLHVVATYVYTTSSDNYAYYDGEHTVKIPPNDLVEIFIKGMIIEDYITGAIYRPISCYSEDEEVTVTYVTTDSSEATTAKLATVISE